MAVSAASRGSAMAAGWLPGLLVAGAAANGLAARIAEVWTQQGFSPPFLGVSPFDLMAIAVATMLIAGRGGPADVTAAAPRFGLPELALVAILLVPSSTIAWIGVLIYGLVLARRLSGERRAGALLAVALAASALWTSHGIKLLAMPITTLEARIVANLLSLVRSDIVQTGNVVGVAGGHLLVILTACSVLDGLPRVLVAVSAVALFLGGWTLGRLVAGLVVASIVLALGNEARLIAMAWSAEGYGIAHGPIGTGLFDLFQTGLVIAVGAMVARR
jgi:hypothetical protein